MTGADHCLGAACIDAEDRTNPVTATEMETTMKTTTRRAALISTAGVTAAIGSALTAAPASAEDPVTIATDVEQTVYCNQYRPIGTENGALARITTSCSNGLLTVTGSIDDTEQDGRSACVVVRWLTEDGLAGAGEFARDTQDDNIVTTFPSDWKHSGNRVNVHVYTCN